MSEIPPYASYPRGTTPHAPHAALRSLANGYFGLSRVFAVNIVLAFASRAIQMLTGKGGIQQGLMVLGLTALVTGLIVGFLSYGSNKKIGEGAGWSPAQPVIASILMGINSALCCGVVGYIVMQTIAANHLKRYGIRMGLFSTKTKVEGQIASIEAQGGRTY